MQYYLRCNALVAIVLQQVSHHLQVILLSSHVEWSKAILQQQRTHQIRSRYLLSHNTAALQCFPIWLMFPHLRLRVNISSSLHQQPDHILLSRQRGDVEGRVAFLQRKSVICGHEQTWREMLQETGPDSISSFKEFTQNSVTVRQKSLSKASGGLWLCCQGSF